jgi:hypothetical protein
VFYAAIMPPQFWANEEQLLFLRNQRSDFTEAQKRKSLPKFWGTVERLWFEKWPEPATAVMGTDLESDATRQELGQQIEKRKKVIDKITCLVADSQSILATQSVVQQQHRQIP